MEFEFHLQPRRCGTRTSGGVAAFLEKRQPRFQGVGMAELRDAVIVATARTPMGRFGGHFRTSVPTTWPRWSSGRRSSAPACRPPMSRTSCSAAPTSPARTTATWPGWGSCWPASGRGARPDRQPALRLRHAGRDHGRREVQTGAADVMVAAGSRA